MFPPRFSPPLAPGLAPVPNPHAPMIADPYPLAHSAVPVGAIIIFPGEILQQTGNLTGAITDLRYMPWMICDGTSLRIAEYPDLHRVIGTLYGSSGDGSFNLPDYRGYFLRGVDLQKNLDHDQRKPPAGQAADPQGVGSTQEDALRDHEHQLTMNSKPILLGTQGTEFLEAPNSQSNTGNIVPKSDVRVSDTETRSVNISVNWLIRTQ